MTIHDTCKYWESVGQKGVYEKTFEYAFRKIGHALKMFKKAWYINCILSEDKKRRDFLKEWDHLPF